MLNSPTMMDATDLTVSVTVMAHTNVQRQKLSIFVTIQIPGDVDNVRSKVKHIEEIQDFHMMRTALDTIAIVIVMVHGIVQLQELSIFATIPIPADVDNVRSKVKHIKEIHDFHMMRTALDTIVIVNVMVHGIVPHQEQSIFAPIQTPGDVDNVR